DDGAVLALAPDHPGGRGCARPPRRAAFGGAGGSAACLLRPAEGGPRVAGQVRDAGAVRPAGRAPGRPRARLHRDPRHVRRVRDARRCLAVPRRDERTLGDDRLIRVVAVVVVLLTALGAASTSNASARAGCPPRPSQTEHLITHPRWLSR